MLGCTHAQAQVRRNKRCSVRCAPAAPRRRADSLWYQSNLRRRPAWRTARRAWPPWTAARPRRVLEFSAYYTWLRISRSGAQFSVRVRWRESVRVECKATPRNDPRACPLTADKRRLTGCTRPCRAPACCRSCAKKRPDVRSSTPPSHHGVTGSLSEMRLTQQRLGYSGDRHRFFARRRRYS